MFPVFQTSCTVLVDNSFLFIYQIFVFHILNNSTLDLLEKEEKQEAVSSGIGSSRRKSGL